MQQTVLTSPTDSPLAELCKREPLERCPCCGGKAIHQCNPAQFAPGAYWFWVQCDACGLATRYVPGTAAKCIPLVTAAWNTRTPASKSAAKDTAP